MAHTTIAADQEMVTVTNIFVTVPDAQQQLVDLLNKACDEVISHRAGFISANIPASLDGTRVVNYVQWCGQENLWAMLADPEANKYVQAALMLSTSDVRPYAVAAVHHA
jgi:Antibiotic biosynthesis monooxygenase